MKWKKWLPVVLAIVLGGIAAKIARDSMLRSRHVQILTPKLVQIVVADVNLQTGNELKPTDVTTIVLTSPTPPPDSFANPADLVGRVVLTPILKGQTMLGANLAPKGVAPSLSALIPAGMRSITMNVDDVNSQTGMLVAGSHVDLVSTMGNGKEMASHTLLKDVLVQAVGTRVMPKSEDPKDVVGPYHTISLIVTPHDGELIQLATMTARLHIMLRGATRNDSAETDPGYVTVADIVGDGERIIREASSGSHPTTNPSENKLVAKTPKWTVELIKGGGAPTLLEFDMPRSAMHAEDDLRPAIPGADDHSQQ